MKRILLTGGNGFIGKSILSSYLSTKYEIIAPTSQELDLRDSEKVSEYVIRYFPDIIIHGALVPYVGVSCVYDNLLMYQNIIRFSTMCEKIIHFSSGAAYDNNRHLRKVKESEFGLHIPKSPYGFSKYMNTLYGSSIPNVIELFIFGLFGPLESNIRFIKNNVLRCIKQEPVNLRGRRIMDYVYIDDFIRLLDEFIQIKDVDIWQRYNITSQSVSLSNLLNLIYTAAGRISNDYNESDIEYFTYTGNNARLKRLLPDFAFTPLSESISKMYRELEKNA